MPFQSCYGLSKLLGQYGIDSQGIRVGDKSEAGSLPVPFVAQTGGGFVVVTEAGPTSVEYLSEGKRHRVSREVFEQVWSGMALLARAGGGACEPDYGRHRRQVELSCMKRWLLVAAVAFVVVYLFVSRGLWANVGAWFVTVFDFAGLFFTYLLVQKSAKVKSRLGDKVCGLLEQGGCDSVLSTKAATFFGLFGWSEVGLAYFSVSLAALLLFPELLGSLTLINACCLPFTLWSIWYQKFRAKAWCTLCVCTQATLWCLFFSYLGAGGWTAGVGISWSLIALGATYVAVLLGLNRMMPLIEKIKTEAIDETDFIS